MDINPIHSNPRILADGRVFGNTHQRGIQRYGRELFSRVARTYPVDLFLTGAPMCPLPNGVNTLKVKERFTALRANLPLRAWRKWRRRYRPTRFSGHALYHSIYFEDTAEPGIPEIVTLHDMLVELFRQFFPGREHIDQKLQAMNRAAKIICISQATADDAARIYPHLQDKLRVVHSGADHFRPVAAEVERPSAEGRPYILFVGDRGYYKNFATLLAAMGENQWPKDLALTVAGAPLTQEEAAEVRRRGLEDRVDFRGFVPDPELRDLYRHATAFVFPSLGEGFGFPTLEAQAMRVPVLCSDRPVFREVGGDGAIYFDPEDPGSIAGAVERVRSLDTQALVEAGIRNVGRFSWDRCAEQTCDVYRSVLT